MIAAMAVFLAIMIGARDRNAITGWDYIVAASGAVAALVLFGIMHLRHKRQTQRERLFGESLREQLSLRIAQFDDDATCGRWTLAMVTLAGICPIAILVLGWRINGKSIGDDGYMVVWLILLSIYAGATGIWELQRQLRLASSRKQRLKELLEEIDGQ